MRNKRTITTLEKIKVNGVVKERTATHIVTGAHGYETLCTSGYNIDRNEEGEVIQYCVKLAENQLPITCSTCYTVWHDTFCFTADNFNTGSAEGKFVATPLTEITLPE